MKASSKLLRAGDVLDCAPAVVPFASNLGQAFASIPMGPFAQQVVPIRSSRFRAWLADNFYRQFEAPPFDSALHGALRQLEASAWFNQAFNAGARPHVARRIASRPGSVVLDLYNESGDVVEITAAGWRTLTAPVASQGFCFSNARNARPLPVPTESAQRPAAALTALRALLNLESAENWAAVLAWILACLRPSGPYPILILRGSPGTGKTTAARLLRALLDPNVVPFQPLPRSENELLRLAHSHWILAFDHVRRLPFRLTDTLVRLSSGAVLAMRETAGDLDPLHLYLQRPLIVTVPADDHAATWTARSSVAAHSIVLDLPAIPASQLRPQQDLLAEFDALHPALLGSLCDAVAVALSQPAAAPPRGVHRFVELADWLQSTAPVVGVPPSLLLAWLSVQNPLVDAIHNLLSSRNPWTGTPTELFQELPKFARSAHALTRLINALDPVGFQVKHTRPGKHGERRITLTGTDATLRKVASVGSPQPAQAAEYKTARI